MKENKCYHVSIAEYSKRTNAVEEKRLANFDSIDDAEEFFDTNTKKPIYVWCNGFADTSWGYLPGIFWTQAYLDEYKRIID